MAWFGLSLAASAVILLACIPFVVRHQAKNPAKYGAKVKARHIRAMLRRCAVCGQSLKNHSFHRFGVTIGSPENAKNAASFLKAISEHRWTDVAGFKSFDVQKDTYGADVVRCNLVPLLTTLVTWEPADFGIGEEFVHLEVLDGESSRELESLIEGGRTHAIPGDRWVDL